METNLKLTMAIRPGMDGWFVGKIVEIPGVLTQGKTIEETKANLLDARSEEHTSELQSLAYLVCRLLLEKKNSFVWTPRGAGTTPAALRSATIVPRQSVLIVALLVLPGTSVCVITVCWRVLLYSAVLAST